MCIVSGNGGLIVWLLGLVDMSNCNDGDRLERIEVLVESNAKAIQDLIRLQHKVEAEQYSQEINLKLDRIQRLLTALSRHLGVV